MATRLFVCAVILGWTLPTAATQEPKTANDFYKRGLAWIEKGEFDKAIKDLDEAVRLNPKLAEAFASRSGLWAEKGEFDKAIKDSDSAIRLDPKLADAFISR